MPAPRLDGMRQLILKRRSPVRKLALALAWLMLGTALRWFLDRGQGGVPFLTLLPVILITGLILGGRYAILSAAGSLLLVRLLFVPTGWTVDNPVRVAMLLIYILSVDVGGHLAK